jgi:hypothetical protein
MPFRVCNYETAQPPELAYQETPYVWAVETRYSGPTDHRSSRVFVSLAGRKGGKRLAHYWFHGWDVGTNHTEAALEFMRRHILSPGEDAELVGMFSTASGFLFIFR